MKKNGKEFTYYIALIFLLLSVVGWYCKGKGEKQKPQTFIDSLANYIDTANESGWPEWADKERYDTAYSKWNNAAAGIDTTNIFSGIDDFVFDTATTYVFEGEYDHPIGKVKHTIPIDTSKYGRLALRGDPPKTFSDEIRLKINIPENHCCTYLKRVIDSMDAEIQKLKINSIRNVQPPIDDEPKYKTEINLHSSKNKK